MLWIWWDLAKFGQISSNTVDSIIFQCVVVVYAGEGAVGARSPPSARRREIFLLTPVDQNMMHAPRMSNAAEGGRSGFPLTLSGERSSPILILFGFLGQLSGIFFSEICQRISLLFAFQQRFRACAGPRQPLYTHRSEITPFQGTFARKRSKRQKTHFSRENGKSAGKCRSGSFGISRFREKCTFRASRNPDFSWRTTLFSRFSRK